MRQRQISVCVFLLASGLIGTLAARAQGPAAPYKDLPPPYATPSADNPPRVVPRPPGAALRVPAGFRVAEFASGFDNPRWLALAPNGDVFLAESRPGRIRVLRDADGDGVAEGRFTYATGLTQPFGMAFHDGYFYVANTNAVVRFPYRPGDLQARGEPQKIAELPGYGYRQHWTRNILFNPKGTKMVVSVGSETNVSEEERRRAAILEFNPDGTGMRIFASGLRNPVGLAWNPVTGELWAAVNERDGLGDDLPPDYVTSVRDGGFYGWPYAYGPGIPDPRLRGKRPDLVAKTITPDVPVGAHTAALGLVFYTGKQFPAAYRNDAFVALHGSWNRSRKSGYKVIRIPFENGKPAGRPEDFLTGWLTGDEKVWGRPVGLLVDRHGSLLVVDDGADKVWRVTYGR